MLLDTDTASIPVVVLIYVHRFLLITKCRGGRIGNKIDTLEDEDIKMKQSQDLFDLAGTNGFSEVTVCLQCSAKTVANVNDVFHYAQLSAVYPVTQLYDRGTRALKPACKDAFTRIFVMCE